MFAAISWLCASRSTRISSVTCHGRCVHPLRKHQPHRVLLARAVGTLLAKHLLPALRAAKGDAMARAVCPLRHVAQWPIRNQFPLLHTLPSPLCHVEFPARLVLFAGFHPGRRLAGKGIAPDG